jgi:hypothetical protein
MIHSINKYVNILLSTLLQSQLKCAHTHMCTPMLIYAHKHILYIFIKNRMKTIHAMYIRTNSYTKMIKLTLLL